MTPPEARGNLCKPRQCRGDRAPRDRDPRPRAGDGQWDPWPGLCGSHRIAGADDPGIDYAPVVAAFGFQAATVRTLEGLQALAPLLANPDGPILLDCKINGAVAAPFLPEGFAQEKRKPS